jgi:hypothetical protein
MACFPILAARLVGLAFLLALAPEIGIAEDGSVAIKSTDCSRLVKHLSAPDVAYQAGVDVQGRAVAPADLQGGYQISLPETIRIPITVLLQDRFGIPANSVLYKGEAEIGVAEVSLDGERVTFNGRELGSPEMRALSAACEEILRGP